MNTPDVLPDDPVTAEPPAQPTQPGWWLWDRFGWVGPYPTVHQAQAAAVTEDGLGYILDQSTVCVVCVVNTPTNLARPVTPHT